MAHKIFDTPWKASNEFRRLLGIPYIWTLFKLNGIPWGKVWRIYGVPIIQKHRYSAIKFGSHLSLRSFVRSNPLGPNHSVILCTWQSGAAIQVGDHFGMTGGTLCAAECISIGNNVVLGANCTVIDTDFHPLEPGMRRASPQSAQTAAITIEDDVFVGMDCLVLKGVKIGQGSVIGAGSVVSRDVPAGVIVAGNPARFIREL